MATGSAEGAQRSQRSRGGRSGQGRGQGHNHGRGEAPNAGEGPHAGQHQSNGRSQPRRGGSIGSGRRPQLSASPPATHDFATSEADLKQRLDDAQAAEIALRADEHRLRQDLTAAEEARDRRRRHQERARETAEDGHKRASRTVEFLRGELSELMQSVLGYEQAEKEYALKETAWQAELDSMVLAQAQAMTRRDELTAEVRNLEEQARADEARASKVESRARHVEERCKKERERVENVKQEAEVSKCNLDAARTAQQQAGEEELLRHQEEGALGITIWRCVAGILAASVVCAAGYRVADPRAR